MSNPCCLDSIPHMQGQASQYSPSQCLHLCSTLWGMWVTYPSCVTNMWPTYNKH